MLPAKVDKARKEDVNPSNAYLRTIVGNDEDVKWEHLLAPVPMGIAIMSQLMLCASRVQDIRIDANNPGHLIRHPQSFRTTLVQIGNDAHTAFSKAHSNMQQIQLEMAQVPDYVQQSVKLILSGKQNIIDKMLPRRLERIQEAADNGQKLSAEVSLEFKNLIDLIKQVLEAISASSGSKEREIQDKIKNFIEENNKQRLEEKKNESKHLIEMKQFRQESVKRRERYREEFLRDKRNILERIFFPKENEQSLETALQMRNDAEERLEKTTKQIAQVEEEMQKINDDYIEKLQKMQIRVTENINQDKTIQCLKQGLDHLGDLQKNWDGIARYFSTIHNIIKVAISKKLADFTSDAQGAKNEHEMIEYMSENILKSCESSHLMHRTSDMYVKVSDRFIMNNIGSINKMISIKDSQLETVQKELIESCEQASQGILLMVKEEKTKMIQYVKDYSDELSMEVEKLGITN